MTFGEKVIAFNRGLEFTGTLPAGIEIMNPFKGDSAATTISEQFYTKYYCDTDARTLILGINPGRFGAGVTGIPFTDTIGLNKKCGIPFDAFHTHEQSSVFMYDMIGAFGGVREFYKKFFVSAICPLGFTTHSRKGNVVNYNYYDSKALMHAVSEFIVENLRKQINFGTDTSVCFCLGTGKNEDFLLRLNEKYNFFKTIIALEHPRYIMQYKVKLKEFYINKYLSVLKSI